jgi:RNA polymerase sigma factor (sigma-70 family)
VFQSLSALDPMSLVPRSESASAPVGSAHVGTVDYSLPVSSTQEQAFVALYEALFPRLTAFAKRFLDPADAADVVQQTMADTWDRWPVLSIDRPDAAFFFRAVRNRIANHRRSAHRENRRLAQYLTDLGRRSRKESAPDSRLEQAELAAVIEATIAGLPERCREAWLLVRENEFTYKQAADAMQVAERTTTNHLAIANRRLREALSDAGYREAARAAMKQLPRGAGEELP